MVKVRAEIRLGELLAETELHCGAATRSHDATALPKLSDLGIDKHQSSRWQLMASVLASERVELKRRIEARVKEQEGERRGRPSKKKPEKSREIPAGMETAEWAAQQAGFDCEWTARQAQVVVKKGVPVTGIHALRAVPTEQGGRGKKGGLSEYAKKLGRTHQLVSQYRQAAEVFCSIEKPASQLAALLTKKAQHLNELHALPRACWPGAVGNR